MKIGLTNDDGFESPILKFFIKDLNDKGFEVAALFPAEEQSWCSQRSTRFGNLTIQNVAEQIKAVNGTPADCASLLVEFYEVKDLLISGINMGTNASDAFYFSSGTIGAARQAAFYGVKSVAISWTVPPEIYKKWRAGVISESEFEGEFRWVTKCAAILIEYLKNSFDWSETNHISINMPIDKPTVAAFTTLAQRGFKTLYEKIAPETYRFKFGGLVILKQDPASDVDSSTIRNELSITRFKKDFTVNLDQLGPIENLSKILSLNL